MVKTGEWVCGSCAVSSIAGIGDYLDPVSLFKDVLRKELASDYSNILRKLFTFYVFCAGPEVPANARGGSHHSKKWVRYGTEFAQWLVDNKLGEVATLPPKLNAKYHEKSTAQVWLWSPDQEAAERWYRKNMKRAADGKDLKGSVNKGIRYVAK